MVPQLRLIWLLVGVPGYGTKANIYHLIQKKAVESGTTSTAMAVPNFGKNMLNFRI